MRSLLVATVSALALLATQALAQSATGQSQDTMQQAPSGAAEQPSGATSDSPAQAQPGAAAGQEQSAASGQDVSQLQATDLLGKKIKLEGKDEAVGEITDVVVVDGKPQQAVIDMGTMRDTPVAVSIIELTPSGEDFILSMTEQELAEAPPYEAGQQPGATRALDQPAGQQPGATSDQPAGQQPEIQSRPGADSQPGQQSR